MFGELLKIVDYLYKAVPGILKLRKASEYRSAALEMLKTYFLILDAHEDGLRWLESATSDPVNYIKKLDDKALKVQLKIWDTILRRQSRRLYEAGVYISSQSYLAVLDPDAQKSIQGVIGNKMSRVANLHGQGAGLFFRNIFPINESPEDIAGLVVKTLSMEENGLLDETEVREELNSLKKGLDKFRDTIIKFIDKEEFYSISTEARAATRLDKIGA